MAVGYGITTVFIWIVT